ncbi:serine hydrolase domain-containing protein [Caulobacter segnis]
MRSIRRVAVVVAAVLAGLGSTQAQTRQETATPPVAKVAQPPAAAPAIPSASATLTKADVDLWLDGYMPYALRVGDIPGAVVTVVKDGQILTTRGFGYADRDKKTSVDPYKTLFRPGSISKLFTWTAVMQQVEAGKIDLDADINQYLDFKIPAYKGKPVTTRQLMTHTAGFEEVVKELIFYGKPEPELGAYLKNHVPKRIFEAGVTPAYSNYGTALAGYLVERVSGEKFNDYIDRHVTGPLNMRNTTLRQPLPANLAGTDAIGYSKPGKPAKGFEIVGPAPAGSASSTGADMGRFMIAHLQGGELDGQRILSAETAHTMHYSPLDKVNPKSLIGPLDRMELGFFQTSINGRYVIGHLGDTEGFHSSLHLYMNENVGLYLSVNSGGRQGAAGTLRTAIFRDFSDRYLPYAGAPDGKVDAKTSAEHAKAMAGAWSVSRRADSTFLSLFYMMGQAKVAVGPKGELIVPSILGANGRPKEWTEIAPYVWREVGGHDRLAAQVEGGKPVRWSWDFGSPFMVFDRIPAGQNGAWLLPALFASIGVLALTFFYWPVVALVRRRYKTKADISGKALTASRAARGGAGLLLALIVGWGVGVTAMTSSAAAMAGGMDGVMLLLQGLGWVLLPLALATAGWNAWLTWTDGRRWARKLWSVVLVLATLLLFYVALTFHLLAMSVHY